MKGQLLRGGRKEKGFGERTRSGAEREERPVVVSQKPRCRSPKTTTADDEHPALSLPSSAAVSSAEAGGVWAMGGKGDWTKGGKGEGYRILPYWKYALQEDRLGKAKPERSAVERRERRNGLAHRYG